MVMHRLIKDHLEEHLNGAPETPFPDDCEQHLKTCEECRDELNVMQEQAYLVRVLRAGRDVEPRPGFYGRVMERIEAQQRASVWSVFLEPVFGRRLVLASLTLILVLSGYLAFTEGGNSYASPGPEAIMAQDPPDLGRDTQRDRDTILVTLATYQE
jgi:predicted anti-sigma-YlaC factor YlaD